MEMESPGQIAAREAMKTLTLAWGLALSVLIFGGTWAVNASGVNRMQNTVRSLAQINSDSRKMDLRAIFDEKLPALLAPEIEISMDYKSEGNPHRILAKGKATVTTEADPIIDLFFATKSKVQARARPDGAALDAALEPASAMAPETKPEKEQ